MNSKVDAFRSAMRRYPAGVTVVAAGEAPKRIGMTATAACSLTVSPAQLLVCLNKDTVTSKVIKKTGTFSISLLSSAQTELAKRFAGMIQGISGEDKFEDGVWKAVSIDDERPTVPVLNDSVYSFACRLVETHDAETHHIVVGAVEEIFCGVESQALVYEDGDFGVFRTHADADKPENTGVAA